MEELPTGQVIVQDPFWSPRLETNALRAIFHQWQQVDISSSRLVPSSLHAAYDAGLLGGVWVIRGETTGRQPLTAIPYTLWGNRGESQMAVWVKAE